MTAANKSKSILNGVVGDYLDATANGLAIDMGFYRDGKLVDPSQLFRHHNHDGSTSPLRICVLVHGLTDDETTWQYPKKKNNNSNEDNGDGTLPHEDEEQDDYGRSLQRDLGLEPLYLRYNTGLHISTNGSKLCQLMDELWRAVSVHNTNTTANNTGTGIQEIVFIGHSMGGLVTRSACLEAAKRQRPWVRKVGRVIFLGTPHLGSYWEQAGHVVSYTLGAVPRPYMRLAADVVNLRSVGIQDLRFGYVQPEDWQGEENDPDAFLNNTKQRAALLEWVTYYIITGTVTTNPQPPMSLLFGDALVRKDSAQGRCSSNQEHDLGIAPEQTREFVGVSHIQLTRHPHIYRQIQEWMAMPWVMAPTPSPSPSPPPRTEWETDVDVTMEELASTMVVLGAEGEEQNGVQRDMIPAMTSAASKWAHCKGVATLVHAAVDKGVSAVEGVQNELTSEVYGILTYIPSPIAPTVRTVQVVHESCVGGIYSIIRGVNHGVGAIAQLTFDTLDQA
jgi:triacylglycerol lipase